MEEIIKSITEAEESASVIKTEAAERAADIIANASERAAEIAAKSETECKILREVKINDAEVEALAAYDRTVADSAAKAKKYADGVLKNAESVVNEIVGRVTGGNC